MTVLAFDGFDKYSVITELLDNEWNYTGTPSISSTVPRGSGQSLLFDADNMSHIIDLTSKTCVVGAHFRFTTLATTVWDEALVFSIKETVGLGTIFNNQLSLLLNTTTKLLEVRRGKYDGTLLATGSTVILDDNWYYIEFKFKIDNLGLFEVKLTGAVEIVEQTSIDTQGEATNEVLSILIADSSRTDATYIDNYYLLDTATSPNNTYLGETDIKMLTVTADNTTAFTPNTGVNNYALVDEVNPHDGDTTYVSAATIGTRDLYDLENTSTTNSVYSVKVSSTQRKTEIQGKRLDTFIKVGADEQANTSSCSISYLTSTNIYDTSDGVSTAWTASALDSALIGIEIET